VFKFTVSGYLLIYYYVFNKLGSGYVIFLTISFGLK